MDINYLISRAKEALNYSYSPYSKFSMWCMSTGFKRITP